MRRPRSTPRCHTRLIGGALLGRRPYSDHTVAAMLPRHGAPATGAA